MKGHILVVDDEPAIRYTISFVLRKNGYKVTQAEDGDQALKLILSKGRRTDPFDLLLTDIQMPRLSGTELMRELKERAISLPIFVVSGVQDTAFMHSLLENGCSAYLFKPFDLKELARKVDLVLRKTKTRKDPVYDSSAVRSLRGPVRAPEGHASSGKRDFMACRA